MTNTRNVELGQAVYQHTFKMLDAGASQTAGKVVGLYDDIVKAGEAMSDHWDLSGKQDFHIVPISKTV